MTTENFGCQDLLPNILQSYRDEGGINNIDGKNLPSKQAIAKICMRLLQILFPGYHDDEPLHTREVDELTRRRLQTICLQLHQEIMKALNGGDPVAREAASKEIVNHFMGRLPEVRRVLKTDVQAAYEGDPAAISYEEIILSYPCMEAIAIQRLANILYRREVTIIPRIMTEWAHSRTGIDIHPGARIGTHFFIDHGTGVVIGETCRIGNHVKLYHGVTLGAKSFERDSSGRLKKGGQRHPVVEDGVTIYPNSTILGGETQIGHHSTIGGNVFLMHSVPPRTLVSYEEKQLKFLEKPDHTPAEA
jgi:serine O-acetyltransferase